MRRAIRVILFLPLFLAACTAAVQAVPETPTETTKEGSSVIQETEEQPAQKPSAVPELELTDTVSPDPASSVDDKPPSGAEFEFITDFSKHSISYSEILSGGPPKDGIPALDQPQFENVAEADAWLEPVEPVIFVQVGEDARAYPIQVFMWHEIVNDVIADVPIVITFCPLCNTGIAFKRDVDGQTLDFGTTGRLRFSNLIMYDRQTETWWQQATGEAIVGDQTGKQLEFYPAAMISWEDFKTAHPDGKVLSRETGFNRPYGQNPYPGYDDVRRPPFLYRGPETPGELPAVARVLTVELNDEAVAYPFGVLKDVAVVNDTVGGEDLVVLWSTGTASALDSGSVAGGRDVGTANAYLRDVAGQALSFESRDGGFFDLETGSEWDVLGRAISGELSGTQLTPVISINHFWFSWAAFKPDTRIYQPSS